MPIIRSSRVIQMVAACGTRRFGLQVVGLVWSCRLCVRVAGCCIQLAFYFHVIAIASSPNSQLHWTVSILPALRHKKCNSTLIFARKWYPVCSIPTELPNHFFRFCHLLNTKQLLYGNMSLHYSSVIKNSLQPLSALFWSICFFFSFADTCLIYGFNKRKFLTLMGIQTKHSEIALSHSWWRSCGTFYWNT